MRVTNSDSKVIYDDAINWVETCNCGSTSCEICLSKPPTEPPRAGDRVPVRRSSVASRVYNAVNEARAALANEPEGAGE